MAGGTPRRERKVVTVVFCDLVGFTARAESMDPEDVEALLTPYHERVRAELERHGGTVEKFIGDAVMALFGAPTAHEDDPERAVRAALAIREFALEEGLELRVGITTGEALVRLDAQPDAGEGMASGDVVNTAARLQSAAPVNGDRRRRDDLSRHAARRSTTRRPSRSRRRARPSRSPSGQARRRALALRRRRRARGALRARRPRARARRRPGRVRARAPRADAAAPHARRRPGHRQEPPRLRALSAIVDADPELITWRQGRCLAYGDGITLWALGGDREGAGRRPRAGHARRDRREGPPAPSRTRSPAPATRPGSRRISSRSSGSRARRSSAATAATRRSPRGVASSRVSPSSARSSSSSRTSTGPTRASSTSSTSSSTG